MDWIDWKEAPPKAVLVVVVVVLVVAAAVVVGRHAHTTLSAHLYLDVRAMQF